ncbi:MAG TPA: G1 family glutamic endopeptidase [Chloroflexota bacterium]|nr:G1 family glutamic endopeptidase [Chloroflexota bacterium]
MPLVYVLGRALRRGIALGLLGLIRGRRVLVAAACVAVVAYAAYAYVNPAARPVVATARPSPGQARASGGGETAGRGAAANPAPAATPAGAAGTVAANAAASGSAEAAVEQVIERGDAEQAQALASGDPTVMRDTATDAYYQQAVQINQDLAANGVTSIHLDKIEWEQVTVAGDVATAVAYETWTTQYADGSTDQTRDRNVYGLVRENGVWLVASDDHPDEQPAGAGSSGGGSPPGTPTPSTSAPGATRPGVPSGPRPAPSGAEPGPSGATTGPSTATTAPAPPTGRARSRSSNWAGYAATGGSFTAVSGTWAVPHPATTGAAGESAVWVGIGGENSRDLIQAGTEEIVSGTGQVRYDAWVETLPAAPHQVPFVVRPGDTVSVSIVQQSGDGWTVSFANATTGAAYQQNVQYRSSLSSAEWIVEAPGGFRGQTGPLDDFGTVTFTSCSAVADGKTVNLADAGARPITLVGRGELPLATTSPLTPDGAGFTVTRANAAQPPAPATSRRGG